MYVNVNKNFLYYFHLVQDKRIIIKGCCVSPLGRKSCKPIVDLYKVARPIASLKEMKTKKIFKSVVVITFVWGKTKKAGR